jgi:hypothetical protein
VKEQMATEIMDRYGILTSAAALLSYPRNLCTEASGDLLDREKVLGIKFGRRTATGLRSVKVR